MLLRDHLTDSVQSFTMAENQNPDCSETNTINLTRVSRLLLELEIMTILYQILQDLNCIFRRFDFVLHVRN